MPDSLSTTTSSQSQSTTQSPQSSAQSINSGSKTSSVQPGTATNLLNGPGIIPLHPTALTSVNLANNSPVTTASAAQPAKQQHHVNSVFFGFAITLFLAAAVLAWTISRSAKSNNSI